jgi:hypothetical protein
MKLSTKAEEAVRRIRALRKLPKSVSTQNAEKFIYDHLPLKDIPEVALALETEETTEHQEVDRG